MTFDHSASDRAFAGLVTTGLCHRSGLMNEEMDRCLHVSSGFRTLFLIATAFLPHFKSYRLGSWPT